MSTDFQIIITTDKKYDKNNTEIKIFLLKKVFSTYRQTQRLLLYKYLADKISNNVSKATQAEIIITQFKSSVSM